LCHNQTQMEKLKGYNRNCAGGRRPHKKIQRFGKYKTLAERMKAESEALEKYRKRVNQ
jgi:hypothetical protein